MMCPHSLCPLTRPLTPEKKVKVASSPDSVSTQDSLSTVNLLTASNP